MFLPPKLNVRVITYPSPGLNFGLTNLCLKKRSKAVKYRQMNHTTNRYYNNKKTKHNKIVNILSSIYDQFRFDAANIKQFDHSTTRQSQI